MKEDLLSQSAEPSFISLSSPKFREVFESPLSTKREKMRTPMQRRTAPRVVKTVPPMRSVYGRSQEFRPMEITLTGTKSLSSPHYNPMIRKTYFQQNFEIIRKIGEGSFGDVFCVRSLEDHRNYAVKVSIEVFRNTTDRAKKLREVENHMRLPKHTNIVEFVKSWEEKGRLYIQTELCERSLLSYCMQNHKISDKTIWKIFVDLLLAVDFLHSNDLIHDDIKPDNIFLTKNFVCKLGDFGLVINLQKDELKNAEEGDSKYLAPEVLNGRPSKASDIFSLGVTMLEAATDMDLPSCGDSWHQIRNGQIPERFFEGIDKDIRYLIEWMLRGEPSARPTTKDLSGEQGGAAARRRQERHSPFSLRLEFYENLKSRRDAIYGSPDFARLDHTPIHTPDSAKDSSRPTSRMSYDYSDDEHYSVNEHQDDHSQRRLFEEPKSLLPGYLIADDGISSYLESNEEHSPPRRIHDAQGDVRIDFDENDALLKMRLRQEKLRRIEFREREAESDDNDNIVAYKAMSCPPVRKVRPLIRMPPPVLDFTMLDSKNDAPDSTTNNNITRRSSRSRRMVCDAGSSADEA
ncbi:unnamed protein product [Caenorhabditis auriculariae]|uniref:Membrane-associated tyrosine- and threonine-specific cdc2-inhibitory kinase wee-1.3 n=1 Tax=Caenorhabditis auriculariae TaxID=2777116 RepID=A0A8S1HCD7_9PELO|nr:unnamed protein product [Caenorhabditis auriculariae]